MNARQFGRDSGDTYGRHALVNPGGDNRQIDVALILNAHMAALLNEFDESYLGRHRHGPGRHPVEFLTDDRAPYISGPKWQAYR